jgi:biopolymer transport protein ExbB/TolQ
MNTSQDLSIISLVLNASVLAQAVMGLLLLLSLMSWTFIFRKWFAIRRARADRALRTRFLVGRRPAGAVQSAANNRHTIGALERIFEAGMREFLKAKEKRLSDPGSCSTAHAARCARRSSAKWTCSKRISRSSRRSARSARTSVCSAPCGAS